MQRLLQQMDRIYSQMPWIAFPSLPIHPSTHGDNSGGKETHRKWGAVDRTLFQERIPNPLLFFPFGKQRLTVVQEQYRVDLSNPCHRCPVIQGSDFPTGRGIRGVG